MEIDKLKEKVWDEYSGLDIKELDGFHYICTFDEENKTYTKQQAFT